MSTYQFQVSAKFIGADGSLGYRHGFIYTLDITQVLNRGTVHISDAGNSKHKPVGKPCEYDSMKAFLNNCADVTVIKS